jgi:hypothetical protein
MLLMEKELSQLANTPGQLPTRFSRSKDGFSRNQVVDAFQQAFQLIGGVNRLTLWAHENPTDFFRLYAKLLPATTVSLGDAGAYEIIHSIAPTALDRYKQAKVIDVVIENISPEQQAQILAEASRASD